MKEMGASDEAIDFYKAQWKKGRYYRRPIEIDSRLEEILHSGEDTQPYRMLKDYGYSDEQIRAWVGQYEKGRKAIYGTTKKR